MAYGDVLVHTNGPSYGQNIVRNVGVASGGGGGAPDAHAASHEDGGADELDLTGLSGGFQNPYPLVAGFLEDIEMRDDKTLWLDIAKTIGLTYSAVDASVYIFGTGIFRVSSLLAVLQTSADNRITIDEAAGTVLLDTLEGFVLRVGGVSALEGYDNGGGVLVSYFNSYIQSKASSADFAGLNIPPGIAPTVPVDGDIWVDAAGDIFLQRAGVTKQFMFV